MRNHYRYFQRGEKTPWIPVPDDGAEQAALAEGAVRLTVLCTSKILGGIDSEEAPKDVKFHGPLYFDIDHKEDIELAIASANKLCDRLIEEYGMDPADIQVFLSGSKGLHLFIAPKHFGLERSEPRLPKVYMEMAKHLYVSGVDMQVYSMRNAFRLPNVKRDDGKYRVQVTVAELRELDEKTYRKLVRQPREDFRAPASTDIEYTQLSVLFQAAKDAAKRGEREISDASQVYAPVLKQHFAAEPPPCMLHLADGKRAESKSFNEMAMQVAIFAARLNPDGLGTFEPTYARIADNQHSTTYSSARQRREHIDGLVQFAKHSPKLNFSCNATRSVLKSRVCEECPLEAVQAVETKEDAAKVVGIAARADGYFDMTQKSPRRISTFILEPEYIFKEVTEDGQDRRVGTVATVKTNGQAVGSVLIEENAWLNRMAFLKTLNGVGNLSFFGSDADIQKMKFVTMAETDLPERSMVREMGMHTQRINDKEIRTYVEKGASINNLKIKDSMVYDEPEPFASPFLLASKLKLVDQHDVSAREGLKLLLQMNAPHIMGFLAGWNGACHIKSHLMTLYRQFPLINLWGNAGAAKTTTAAYASNLGGVDFVSEHEVMNLPNSTPYAWLESLSNSASSPLIWDEVNRSNDRMPPKLYARALELLKAAFNGQVAARGALSNSAKSAVVRKYRLVRPTIYCSEQPPEMPAVVDRSLMLMMTEKELQARDGMDRKVRPHLSGLQRVAYTLMVAALGTPSDEIADLLNHHMDRLDQVKRVRQRYGIAVSLAGLTWMTRVLEKRGLLDEELTQLLVQAEAAMYAHADEMATEEANRKVSTEVDRVFSEIMEILDLGMQQDAGIQGLQAPLRLGVHFSLNTQAGQHLLYLDARTAHSAYLVASRRKGVSVVLDELRTFCKLALQEEYVRGIFQEEEILDGRHAICVDLRKAAMRGLPTSYFGKASEF